MPWFATIPPDHYTDLGTAFLGVAVNMRRKIVVMHRVGVPNSDCLVRKVNY
jgi:hypothetical protein